MEKQPEEKVEEEAKEVMVVVVMLRKGPTTLMLKWISSLWRKV